MLYGHGIPAIDRLHLRPAAPTNLARTTPRRPRSGHTPGRGLLRVLWPRVRVLTRCFCPPGRLAGTASLSPPALVGIYESLRSTDPRRSTRLLLAPLGSTYARKQNRPIFGQENVVSEYSIPLNTKEISRADPLCKCRILDMRIISRKPNGYDLSASRPSGRAGSRLPQPSVERPACQGWRSPHSVHTAPWKSSWQCGLGWPMPNALLRTAKEFGLGSLN